MKRTDSTKTNLQEDFLHFSNEVQIFIDQMESENIAHKSRNRFIIESIHKNLIQISKAALLSHAKRIRPLFCYWIYRSFSLEKSSDNNVFLPMVSKIALSIEILHNASLIIDDIEDGSKERRHKAALHMEFGLPNALNAASWMYFLAIETLPTELHKLASKALLDCHVGQAIDLSSNQNSFSANLFSSSSQERWSFYENCVELKTTRLMLLSLECLTNILNLNDVEYSFIESILKKYGIIFQIYDDLKNIFPELSGNKINEDLKTGLRSSISLEFLDILSREEKQFAFHMFLNETFFDYMMKHIKFAEAVQNCFLRAEKLLHETRKYINKYFPEESPTKIYISQLFDSPFLEVRQKLSHKISSVSKDNLNSPLSYELKIL